MGWARSRRWYGTFSSASPTCFSTIKEGSHNFDQVLPPSLLDRDFQLDLPGYPGFRNRNFSTNRNGFHFHAFLVKWFQLCSYSGECVAIIFLTAKYLTVSFPCSSRKGIIVVWCSMANPEFLGATATKRLSLHGACKVDRALLNLEQLLPIL